MYQHLLLAADFSDHIDVVAQKAQSLADLHQAQLSLLHVVDNVPISDSNYEPVVPFAIDFTDELIDEAKKNLEKLGVDLGVPIERQWLELGSPKLEIVRIAEENHIDLIVIGSHTLHGLAVLLGSTADDVIRKAQCDVLAVHLPDD